MKSSTHYIKPLFAALLILGVSVIGILSMINLPPRLVPTPVPTPSFPTPHPYQGYFVNEFLGYSIDLPPSWQATVYRQDLQKDSWVIVDPPKTDMYEKEDGMFIQAQQLFPNEDFNKNVTSWFSYYYGSTSGLGDGEKKIVSQQTVTLDSRKGVKYVIDVSSTGETAIWYFYPLNDTHLLLVKTKSKKTKVLDDYALVLATLKFGGTQTPSADIFCGGIAGIMCPAGFSCKLNGNYPDASGKCIRD